MPSTDRKLEVKAKTSVAQTGSQPFVYAKGLIRKHRLLIVNIDWSEFPLRYHCDSQNYYCESAIFLHAMIVVCVTELAAGCRTEDRFPAREESFLSLPLAYPYPVNLISSVQGSCPLGGVGAGVWTWLLTFIKFRGLHHYTHSLVRL
jgi:hypothetical protein